MSEKPESQRLKPLPENVRLSKPRTVGLDGSRRKAASVDESVPTIESVIETGLANTDYISQFTNSAVDDASLSTLKEEIRNVSAADAAEAEKQVDRLIHNFIVSLFDGKDLGIENKYFIDNNLSGIICKSGDALLCNGTEPNPFSFVDVGEGVKLHDMVSGSYVADCIGDGTDGNETWALVGMSYYNDSASVFTLGICNSGFYFKDTENRHLAPIGKYTNIFFNPEFDERNFFYINVIDMQSVIEEGLENAEQIPRFMQFGDADLDALKERIRNVGSDNPSDARKSIKSMIHDAIAAQLDGKVFGFQNAYLAHETNYSYLGELSFENWASPFTIEYADGGVKLKLIETGKYLNFADNSSFTFGVTQYGLNFSALYDNEPLYLRAEAPNGDFVTVLSFTLDEYSSWLISDNALRIDLENTRQTIGRNILNLRDWFGLDDEYFMDVATEIRNADYGNDVETAKNMLRIYEDFEKRMLSEINILYDGKYLNLKSVRFNGKYIAADDNGSLIISSIESPFLIEASGEGVKLKDPASDRYLSGVSLTDNPEEATVYIIGCGTKGVTFQNSNNGLFISTYFDAGVVESDVNDDGPSFIIEEATDLSNIAPAVEMTLGKAENLISWFSVGEDRAALLRNQISEVVAPDIFEVRTILNGILNEFFKECCAMYDGKYICIKSQTGDDRYLDVGDDGRLTVSSDKWPFITEAAGEGYKIKDPASGLYLSGLSLTDNPEEATVFILDYNNHGVTFRNSDNGYFISVPADESGEVHEYATGIYVESSFIIENGPEPSDIAPAVEKALGKAENLISWFSVGEDRAALLRNQISEVIAPDIFEARTILNGILDEFLKECCAMYDGKYIGIKSVRHNRYLGVGNDGRLVVSSDSWPFITEVTGNCMKLKDPLSGRYLNGTSLVDNPEDATVYTVGCGKYGLTFRNGESLGFIYAEYSGDVYEWYEGNDDGSSFTIEEASGLSDITPAIEGAVSNIENIRTWYGLSEEDIAATVEAVKNVESDNLIDAREKTGAIIDSFLQSELPAINNGKGMMLRWMSEREIYLAGWNGELRATRFEENIGNDLTLIEHIIFIWENTDRGFRLRNVDSNQYICGTGLTANIEEATIFTPGINEHGAVLLCERGALALAGSSCIFTDSEFSEAAWLLSSTGDVSDITPAIEDALGKVDNLIIWLGVGEDRAALLRNQISEVTASDVFEARRIIKEILNGFIDECAAAYDGKSINIRSVKFDSNIGADKEGRITVTTEQRPFIVEAADGGVKLKDMATDRYLREGDLTDDNNPDGAPVYKIGYNEYGLTFRRLPWPWDWQDMLRFIRTDDNGDIVESDNDNDESTAFTISEANDISSVIAGGLAQVELLPRFVTINEEDLASLRSRIENLEGVSLYEAQLLVSSWINDAIVECFEGKAVSLQSVYRKNAGQPSYLGYLDGWPGAGLEIPYAFVFETADGGIRIRDLDKGFYISEKYYSYEISKETEKVLGVCETGITICQIKAGKGYLSTTDNPKLSISSDVSEESSWLISEMEIQNLEESKQNIKNEIRNIQYVFALSDEYISDVMNEIDALQSDNVVAARFRIPAEFQAKTEADLPAMHDGKYMYIRHRINDQYLSAADGEGIAVSPKIHLFVWENAGDGVRLKDYVSGKYIAGTSLTENQEEASVFSVKGMGYRLTFACDLGMLCNNGSSECYYGEAGRYSYDHLWRISIEENPADLSVAIWQAIQKLNSIKYSFNLNDGDTAETENVIRNISAADVIEAYDICENILTDFMESEIPGIHHNKGVIIQWENYYSLGVMNGELGLYELDIYNIDNQDTSAFTFHWQKADGGFRLRHIDSGLYVCGNGLTDNAGEATVFTPGINDKGAVLRYGDGALGYNWELPGLDCINPESHDAGWFLTTVKNNVPSGVEQIYAGDDEDCYDLNGRKVSDKYRGIVVTRSGKKIFRR